MRGRGSGVPFEPSRWPPRRMGGGPGAALGHGLAAEEVEREGAEEGGDAVLAQQVQLDELRHGARELRLQQLHLGARGARGLQGRGTQGDAGEQGCPGGSRRGGVSPTCLGSGGRLTLRPQPLPIQGAGDAGPGEGWSCDPAQRGGGPAGAAEVGRWHRAPAPRQWNNPLPATRWPGQLHPLLRGHGGHCVWRIPGGRVTPVTCPLLRESFPPPAHPRWLPPGRLLPTDPQMCPPARGLPLPQWARSAPRFPATH